MNKDILKDLINASGLSQRDFASKIGTTEIQVSKWLSGTRNIKLSTLEEVADKLNMKIIYKILAQ